jgi:glycosyltransferase involved in cell wall biosynthesis
VGNYVLSTPLRNELALLPELVRCVAEQEVRPQLWVLVDDHSTDGSREWLQNATLDNDWIMLRTAPENPKEYLGGHIARIKSWGLEQAVVEAEKRGHAVAHCGILDADVLLPKDHYRRLLARFANDPLLGVASSVLRVPGAKQVEAWQRSDRPRGPTQLFTRSCWDQIGGLPKFQGYDAVANLKAKNRGFKTELVTDLEALHRRETSTREGHARGFRRRGAYAYFLHLNPILVLARSAAYSWDRPHSKGFDFLRGWLAAALERAPRCQDREVMHHYRVDRLKEVANAVIGRGIRFVR